MLRKNSVSGKEFNNMNKKKDVWSIREEIKKQKEKQREMEEKLRDLNAMQVQAENEEIIAAIRAMTAKGCDVMDTLSHLTSSVHRSQPSAYIPNKSNESEVDIDD